MCSPRSVEEFEKAIQPNTKLIYFETPSNPILEILDIAALAGIARARGIPSMIDNTFASPALQQPLKMGVTVVVHAATKYLCGHGDAMGGAVIGPKDYIRHLNQEIIRDFGGCLSPFNAWLILRGIHTLHLRVPAQCSNAQKIAEFLAGHARVERVNYPGLAGHAGHDLARKQMKAFGAMVSFEVKGGYESGKKVMDRGEDFCPRGEPRRHPLLDRSSRVHQPSRDSARTALAHRSLGWAGQAFRGSRSCGRSGARP